MKFFGHPVHAMIILFPTALLPMDLVLSYLAYFYKQESFTTAAFYCLLGGVASGCVAMLTGLLDLVYIPKEKKLQLEAVSHMALSMGQLYLFTLFLPIKPGNLIRLCRPLHLFYYLLNHF